MTVIVFSFHFMSAVNLCISKDKSSTILYLLCAALAMSVILIAFLVYTIKKLEKNSKDYSNGELNNS